MNVSKKIIKFLDNCHLCGKKIYIKKKKDGADLIHEDNKWCKIAPLGRYLYSKEEFERLTKNN